MNYRLIKLIDNYTINNFILKITDKLNKLKYYPVFICLLEGGKYLTNRIVVNLEISYELKFLKVSSFTGITRDNPKICNDIDGIKNKICIVIDDILDTGLTMQMVNNYLLDNNCRRVENIILCSKEKAKVPCLVKPITIPDEFVVGCGMDYNNRFRESNEIYKFYLKE